MPPVIALIPVIASVAAVALGASALISAIVVAVATIAAMVLTKIVTKKPKDNRISQGADLSTKINPNLPRTVCIGQTAIGPSCHFAYTYTDIASKPNRYLMRVLQISDQPISGLLAVYEGKQTLTFAGDVTTGWFACSQHLSATGAPCMWMRVYKGVYSGAVADATLISNTGGLWTSSHKGTGLSYAIVKYDYDSDAFPNGEPELVFAVQGAPLYDDRADSTVSGGSGSQRLADPTTWAYTDNTAIAIAQYLRGFKIGSVRILGVGAEPRDLLAPMLFSAYNTCDQSVAYSGGTEKRYVTGINLGTDQTAQDHLVDLSLAMDGKIFDRGGSITIWPGAVRTPVMNLAMQDIDWTAEKSWQSKASLDQMLNCVQGNFIDKDNFYQERDLPIRTNSTWETNDGGERFSTFLSLKGVNRWSQGQRIMNRTHQASRFNGLAAFVGGIWLMELEQGDWFTLTSPRWGMVTKYFEAHEVTLTKDMRVAIIAEEVATSLDDWVPASQEFARSDTYWASPPAYGLPVPTFTVAAYSGVDPRLQVQDFGTTFTLLTPSGNTGTYVNTVEIEYALTADTSTTYAAGQVTPDQPRRTIGGLVPGTSYSVRARSSDGERFGTWSGWSTVTTPTAGVVKPAGISPVMAANLQYKFNGLITYAAAAGTPATGTISVAAGSLLTGSTPIAYDAMSVGVSGTNGTTVTYFLYVDTNVYIPGAHTLLATTNGDNIFSSDGIAYIGTCPVTYPASGSGGGSGGGGSGGCPWEESYIHTSLGWIQAKDVELGTLVRVLDEDHQGFTWAPIESNEPSEQYCYTLEGDESGRKLTVSSTTPITTQQSTMPVSEVAGHDLPVDGTELSWEPCSVVPVGVRAVRRISVGGKTFSASDTPDGGILTHNYEKP